MIVEESITMAEYLLFYILPWVLTFIVIIIATRN